MTPVLDPFKAGQDTQEAYSLARSFWGSEPYRAIAAWTEALIAQQQAYMTNCAKDKLPDAQVRLKQLRALWEALTAKEPGQTGHVFD